tara:strand:+ start:223 stop:711 length:489 start_codon:yes stop_codon:yes gene_type:complete
MAFKMKGPMFFGSSLKKYGKKSEPVAKMKKKDDDTVMMKRDKMEAKADAIEGGMPSDVADKVFQKKKDKEGSGINYGKKMKPVAKMGHGEDDEEKGGPKMKSPVKKNPGTFGVVTKADVEKMTDSERQAYGRKIFRGPGTTEEKYKKLRSLDIELKGHDDAY